MYRESGVTFSDFVSYDQFELHTYLSYLFQRFSEHSSYQSAVKRSQFSKELVLK